MLGNGRLEAQCFDGARRLAHIRGKLRKKVWINQGDIILLSLRDYQDEKGDVIMKYSGKSKPTSLQPQKLVGKVSREAEC
jgi:translation initiation factor 1A